MMSLLSENMTPADIIIKNFGGLPMKNLPLHNVTKISNLRDVVKNRVKDFPDNPVFLHKVKGKIEKIMPDKFDKDIDALGTAFLSMVNKGARVAILAETRYEWYVTYLATTNGTGCIVPLDKELHAEEIESMLERADVDILVFAKSKIDIVRQVYGKVNTVKHYICMDKFVRISSSRTCFRTWCI